jgi:hypothetical protein
MLTRETWQFARVLSDKLAGRGERGDNGSHRGDSQYTAAPAQEESREHPLNTDEGWR